MGNCQNVTVKDNGIYGSVNNPNFESGGGIALEDGGPFYVYGNSIVYNEGFGLEFYGCNNSTVYNNDILSNNIGIGLENYTGTESWSNVGSGNEVYNNNLIGNAQDVAVGQRSDLVSWDNGYVGNYWSDYQTNYPNASEIGDSGIWNAPYVIDASNTDSHPLINQVNINAPVPTPTPAPTPTPTSSPTPMTSPSIPEFPVWVMPSIFLATAFAAVAVDRKRS
jgi:parallel beta-helix repeat protein